MQEKVKQAQKQDLYFAQQQTKDKAQPTYDLATFLDMINADNLHPEISTSKPVGKEAW